MYSRPARCIVTRPHCLLSHPLRSLLVNFLFPIKLKLNIVAEFQPSFSLFSLARVKIMPDKLPFILNEQSHSGHPIFSQTAHLCPSGSSFPRQIISPSQRIPHVEIKLSDAPWICAETIWRQRTAPIYSC